MNNIDQTEVSGGQWREMVSGGLPVDWALLGVVAVVLSRGISELRPHLRHALQQHPHACLETGELIARAIREEADDIE